MKFYRVLVAIIIVAASLTIVSGAEAMNRSNAINSAAGFQHYECGSGPTTCVNWRFAGPWCNGPYGNGGHGTIQWNCEGTTKERTLVGQSIVCVVESSWSPYGWLMHSYYGGCTLNYSNGLRRRDLKEPFHQHREGTAPPSIPTPTR